MKHTRAGLAVGATISAAVLLTGCATNETPSTDGSAGSSESTLSGELNGSGASSMGSAQEAWIAAFQTDNPDVTVNYSADGSGAGRDAFIAGGAAFAGSDAALSDEELGGTFANCAPDTSAIDLPTYISPIAVVFNVEGVDSLNLDAATIANIFTGTITNWNDPAIAALNAGVTLPDASITAVHRADDSGTTENFTEYLHEVAPDAWTEEPDGTWPLTGGEAAQGTTGLIDAVSGGSNTIGYADASRAGELGVVSIQVGDEFVAPSAEAAAAAVDASPLVEGRADNDYAVALDRTQTEGSVYPLVLISYSIVCEEYEDEATGELVKAYVGYILSEEGQQEAADSAGSAPLSGELATDVRDAIESIS